ncbi:MAG TPA: hypothetical protein VLL54_08285 [Pyrinomonadaceae bacterium]|nr:hypothetical protein [Pyrinomonadaceae bacterium]
MRYSKWIEKLEADELGALWLSKFRYDLSEGNLAPAIEQEFQELVTSKLDSVGDGDPPLKIVEWVINENPRAFDLRNQRTPTNPEPYSLVIKLEVFALFYLRRRVLMTVLDESDNEAEFVWANLGGIITPAFYDGWVKTDREFFWCAPTRLLVSILAGRRPNQGATLLRSRLGLHLMAKGQRIIRIDIPAPALEAKRLAAPTTLDAGTNPAFIPCNMADGYGRTLNLRTISRDVQELVVEKVRFDGTFQAQRVGRIGARLPAIVWGKLGRLLRISRGEGK